MNIIKEAETTMTGYGISQHIDEETKEQGINLKFRKDFKETEIELVTELISRVMHKTTFITIIDKSKGENKITTSTIDTIIDFLPQLKTIYIDKEVCGKINIKNLNYNFKEEKNNDDILMNKYVKKKLDPQIWMFCQNNPTLITKNLIKDYIKNPLGSKLDESEDTKSTIHFNRIFALYNSFLDPNSIYEVNVDAKGNEDNYTIKKILALYHCIDLFFKFFKEYDLVLMGMKQIISKKFKTFSEYTGNAKIIKKSHEILNKTSLLYNLLNKEISCEYSFKAKLLSSDKQPLEKTLLKELIEPGNLLFTELINFQNELNKLSNNSLLTEEQKEVVETVKNLSQFIKSFEKKSKEKKPNSSMEINTFSESWNGEDSDNLLFSQEQKRHSIVSFSFLPNKKSNEIGNKKQKFKNKPIIRTESNFHKKSSITEIKEFKKTNSFKKMQLKKIEIKSITINFTHELFHNFSEAINWLYFITNAKEISDYKFTLEDENIENIKFLPDIIEKKKSEQLIKIFEQVIKNIEADSNNVSNAYENDFFKYSSERIIEAEEKFYNFSQTFIELGFSEESFKFEDLLKKQE